MLSRRTTEKENKTQPTPPYSGEISKDFYEMMFNDLTPEQKKAHIKMGRPVGYIDKSGKTLIEYAGFDIF